MLKIFNTLTKKKEQFHPFKLDEIKIYVCGITVYDLCHLGHARTFMIFDAVIRYLMHCGYNIKYVRNITDIDDKIIQRAKKNNETIEQLTNRTIHDMHIDLDALNIIRPNYEPKVTNYIDTIVNFINLLIQNKYAYITDNGDVFFSIKTANKYGILSHQWMDNKNYIKNKNLINFNTMKKDPKDFTLWKSSKIGEPYWVAPWGKGRPGWHIECSAMCQDILGNHIDIHGGGIDLIFPHHDNELAQSICANKMFRVNVWMHSGMLLFKNEKMSKSLNNFLTIREALKKYDPETIRFFLLSAHYRSQLQYNENNLKNARISLEHLYLSLRGIEPESLIKTNKEKYFISKFLNNMNDDFNTPKAYSTLFEMAHELNISKKNKNYTVARNIAATLKYLANILGILYQKPDTYLTKYVSAKHNKTYFHLEKIQKLIQIREKARQNHQWDVADKIRIRLKIMGIIVEDDSAGKTKWRFCD